jgi:uncharacterized damage-inducible protein DinB
MATERKLAIPAGYNTTASPRVASFAAQLDDQLALLKKDCAGLDVRHLEWQPHPGVNTIGMLLAHLAIVDIWWIRIAPNQIPETETDKVFKDIAGIGGDDDGLPLAPDGKHPATLTGKSLEDYWRMIDRARAVTHQELTKWRDSELDSIYPLRDRTISREWTLYHVLEHFAGHYGQILLLKHLMRDAGILPKPEKK